MDEFVCVTLLANPGEPDAAFQRRLTEFWTHLLRTRPAVYEGVYAEARDYDRDDAVTARRYMVRTDAAGDVAAELAAKAVGVGVIDPDDGYSKAEASSSEWFQIPHT